MKTSSDARATVILMLGLLLVSLPPTAARAEPPTGRLSDTQFLLALDETLGIGTSVHGTGPFEYQWFYNGRKIVGSGGDLLVVGKIQPNDAGTYQVHVTGPDGVWKSPLVQVRIFDPLPPYQTLRTGSRLPRPPVWGPPAIVEWSTLALNMVPTALAPEVLQGEAEYHAFVRPVGSSPLVGRSVVQRVIGRGRPAIPLLPEEALRMHVGQPYERMFEYDMPGCTFRAAGLPPGLTISGNRISGTPTKAGAYAPYLWLFDGIGESARQQQVMLVDVEGLGVQGSFAGLIPHRMTPDNHLGGRVRVEISLSGSFSAVLQFGPRQQRVVGRLAPSEVEMGYDDSPLTFARVRLPPLPDVPERWLNLYSYGDSSLYAFLTTPATPEKRAIHHETFGLAKRYLGHKTYQSSRSIVGRHLFSMSPNSFEDDHLFLGCGFGSLNVNSAFNSTVIGTLPDGTSFTSGGFVTRHRSFDLYAVMGGRGAESVLGSVYLADPQDSLSSYVTLDWHKKPGPRIQAMPAGQEVLGLSGRCWPLVLPPDGGRSLFQLPGNNMAISFADGGMQHAAQHAALFPARFRLGPGYAARFPALNPCQVQLSLSPTTGFFSGRLLLTDPRPAGSAPGPDIKRSLTFRGVFDPQNGMGDGFCLLPQLPDPSASPPTTLQTSRIGSAFVFLATGDYWPNN